MTNNNQATAIDTHSPTQLLIQHQDNTVAILNIELNLSETTNEPWTLVNPTTLNDNITIQHMDAANPVTLNNKQHIKLHPKENIAIDLTPTSTTQTDASKIFPTNIAYLSPLPDEECGIATYTNYLKTEVENRYHASIHRNINDDVPPDSLIHAQIEFGVHPNPNDVLPPENDPRPLIATWHTVLKKPHQEHLKYYHAVDKQAELHIVHTNLQKKWLTQYTNKPIHIVRHGSTQREFPTKQKAREELGINPDMDIAFCFGFAANTKGFDEAIEVANRIAKDRDNFLLIVSAAVHPFIKNHGEDALTELQDAAGDSVKILGKFLTEKEIDLYAAAADALVYNYRTPGWVASASGALHRLLAANRPIIGTADPRLEELVDGQHCLKHEKGDLNEFRNNLELVLNDDEVAQSLANHASRLAKETSWSKTAERHMALYGDAATDQGGELFPAAWHDDDYFDNEAKQYRTPDGELQKWGYRDTTTVNWNGWKKVVQGLKTVLEPETVLDVGTGAAGFVHYARCAGVKAQGCDFSRYAVDNAFKSAKGFVEQCDVTTELPYEDREFDLVTVMDLPEHLYLDDLPTAVEEIHRVTDSYVFYNIGAAMGGSLAERMVLRKGELPPKTGIPSAVAGHVTVANESQWRQWLNKWAGPEWVFRDDLVTHFRNEVPAAVLQNWHTILIMERTYE